MSSAFISMPPAGPSAPPALADLIDFDGFYPAVSLAGVRDAMRIPTDITDTRLRDATMEAMLAVATDLRDWRAVQDLAGFGQLSDCGSVVIGGESRLDVLFRRAVHSLVKADLDEGQRAADTRNPGADRIDALDTTVGDHRRNARWAIRDMLGLPRTVVELI